ncbi:MAG: hypothetical protein O3B84_02970, partial [Chloroflexi bacterium]|nr:hypothetical protein [Chloroflexota bacterium]
SRMRGSFWFWNRTAAKGPLNFLSVSVDQDADQHRDGVENFIFVHEDRPNVERDLHVIVTARLAAVGAA